MEFFVKDYDSIGEHEILGTAMVPKKEILESDGEREEFELRQFAGKNNVQSIGNKKVRLVMFRLFPRGQRRISHGCFLGYSGVALQARVRRRR